MTDPGPICERCTRTWDERLGYCEQCATDLAQQRNTPNGLLEDNFS